MMNMLETPEQAFGRPEVVARTLWVMARREEYQRRYPLLPPPDPQDVIARCEAAAGR